MRAKPKILCLGMSYPDVKAQIDEEGFREDVLIRKEPSVAQAVECVRRNILTEMDGRDYARCVVMEQKYRVEAYTVSQELGSMYDDKKHLHANFNRSSFSQALTRAFGQGVRFQQIILDYFWIPKGTWVMTHWSKQFFRATLPALASFLETRPSRTNPKLSKGVIYLPFCFHCIKQVISSLAILKPIYKISFVYKDELAEHALWAATSDIDPTLMQNWLGKTLHQEDIYCTFTSKDVAEAMDDETVTKSDVIDILRQIEDFGDVRMIRLQPVRKNGGFVRLCDPSLVERGYDQSANNSVVKETDTVTTAPETDESTMEGEEEEEEEEVEETEVEEETKKSKSSPRKRRPKRRRPSQQQQETTDDTPAAVVQEPRLYGLIQDLESYELLGEDPELTSKYEIKQQDSAKVFPEPNRGYWEIVNNEFLASKHSEFEGGKTRARKLVLYNGLLPKAEEYENSIRKCFSCSSACCTSCGSQFFLGCGAEVKRFHWKLERLGKELEVVSKPRKLSRLIREP